MRKILSLVFLGLLGFVSWKMAPISTRGETYNDFFPKSLFEAKLQKNTPEWIKAQIEADFQEIASITADAVETIYREIREKIGGERILHYRILDNRGSCKTQGSSIFRLGKLAHRSCL